MTIEHLLECSADELEAMTDAQLMEFFAPYLKFVRPETGAIKKESKSLSSNPRANLNATIDANIAKARAIAARFGIDLDNV